MDLDKIRSKLKNLESQNNQKSHLWKPTPDSESVVRIVPSKFSPDNPFIELLFHYNFGKRGYLSPASFGKSDPIVEFVDKLKSTGSKDDFLLARKIEPKLRTFLPIIVRGEEDKGVRYWGFGKTVYTALLTTIADPDYGDISDPIGGTDFTIEYSSPSGKETYPSTVIRMKRNVSPLHNDPKIVENLLNNQVEITDVYQEPEFDELEKLLTDWLNPEKEDEDSEPTEFLEVSDTKSTESDQSPVTASVTSESSDSDFEDAFDEIFDN